jgi:hypothetical protein
MGVINAIDRDGAEHRLEGLERASFMEIMKRAGLSVEIATLEGEAEEIMRPNSRLGCQLRWDESYDGIRVTVAPEL